MQTCDMPAVRRSFVSSSASTNCVSTKTLQHGTSASSTLASSQKTTIVNGC